MQRGCSRRTFVTVALLTLALTVAHAAPQSIIRHEYASERRDERLEELLYLTIGVELANAGFSSTKTSDIAPFTLAVSYVSRETEADVELALSERDRPEAELARVAFTLALDYSIDEKIAEHVSALMAQSGLLDRKETSDAQPSAIQGLFQSSLGAGMTPDELLAATAIRVDASVGAGGMVFAGKMMDYFHYGATVAASVAARKPWERASLSIGLRLAGTRAFNDAGVSGGPLYLSAAGADVQVGTGYNRAFRIAGAVSGGAAVVSVAGDGDTLSKTIPYAETGALVRLPAGKRFAFGLDFRFLAAFDRDLVIMGFSPTLSVCKEL